MSGKSVSSHCVRKKSLYDWILVCSGVLSYFFRFGSILKTRNEITRFPWITDIETSTNLSGNTWRLPFTWSIRVEIIVLSIQYCRLSKRKMEKKRNQRNVLVLESSKKKRKSTPIPKRFKWMVCTISFSNQNSNGFRVNGKCLLFFYFVMIVFRDFFATPLSPKVVRSRLTKWITETYFDMNLS